MQQKRQRVRIVGTFVCALTLVTSIHAQTGSPGVYFPPSAWDLKIPDAARFLVLIRFEGLAVLDTETGLVWERAPGDVDRNGIVNLDDSCLGSTRAITASVRALAAQRLASPMGPRTRHQYRISGVVPWRHFCPNHRGHRECRD